MKYLLICLLGAAFAMPNNYADNTQKKHLYPDVKHPAFMIESLTRIGEPIEYPPVCVLKGWGLNEQWSWYLDEVRQEIVFSEKKLILRKSIPIN